MENKIKINRIKAVLAEKDVSHKELAIRVGIAPNSVTRICNNEFQPTLKLLREMALALDVDIRELLIPTRNAWIFGSRPGEVGVAGWGWTRRVFVSLAGLA